MMGAMKRALVIDDGRLEDFSIAYFTQLNTAIQDAVIARTELSLF
jgi:hypothetical protein